MRILPHIITKAERVLGVTAASAHCDLPCGVYDPAQARIEAEAVHEIMKKHADDTDVVFRQRAVLIKEQRAELVKHHLWVLWTDYFTPEHVEAHPELHDLFWTTTKLAGEAKHSVDPAVGQRLLDAIGRIEKLFWETKTE
ncbi:MAG TPA: superoxide dismutase, Ni [Acidimicrobiales bacterium]|nr:superoxide dismutase, Ni [Acidimicrobiales bacterium]